jgi:hypothetical protein
MLWYEWERFDAASLRRTQVFPSSPTIKFSRSSRDSSYPRSITPGPQYETDGSIGRQVRTFEMVPVYSGCLRVLSVGRRCLVATPHRAQRSPKAQGSLEALKTTHQVLARTIPQCLVLATSHCRHAVMRPRSPFVHVDIPIVRLVCDRTRRTGLLCCTQRVCAMNTDRERSTFSAFQKKETQELGNKSTPRILLRPASRSCTRMHSFDGKHETTKSSDYRSSTAKMSRLPGDATAFPGAVPAAADNQTHANTRSQTQPMKSASVNTATGHKPEIV